LLLFLTLLHSWALDTTRYIPGIYLWEGALLALSGRVGIAHVLRCARAISIDDERDDGDDDDDISSDMGT
jgi:hypothetical protein